MKDLENPGFSDFVLDCVINFYKYAFIFYLGGYIHLKKQPLDELEKSCLTKIDSKQICDLMSADSLPNAYQAMVLSIFFAFWLDKHYSRGALATSLTTTSLMSLGWEFHQKISEATNFNTADFKAEVLGAMIGGLIYALLAKKSRSNTLYESNTK